MSAYDMSRYQRIIAVDSGRITGKFEVTARDRESEAWATAIEVTVWDENRYSGRMLYSNDLTGSVKDGVAKLSKHMVGSNKLADVEEVWDEMLAALVAVVAEYWATAPEVSS
jgi:hypothetical protein